MKPYNKVNHKMEKFFIKKTSFSEPSAEILNNEIRLFEEFLIVGVNKDEFEKKLQTDDNKTKITYFLKLQDFILFHILGKIQNCFIIIQLSKMKLKSTKI